MLKYDGFLECVDASLITPSDAVRSDKEVEAFSIDYGLGLNTSVSEIHVIKGYVVFVRVKCSLYGLSMYKDVVRMPFDSEADIVLNDGYVVKIVVDKNGSVIQRSIDTQVSLTSRVG